MEVFLCYNAPAKCGGGHSCTLCFYCRKRIVHIAGWCVLQSSGELVCDCDFITIDSMNSLKTNCPHHGDSPKTQGAFFGL